MVEASVFSSPIAIVGLAFRFPGDLSDETEFWEALSRKRDLVTEIPAERWAVAELQHGKRSAPGRSVTFSAGVLSRIDEFDAGFFGISPREAAWLDPQQRLLLELAWECMENASVPAASLAGTDCAVYVGISGLDYGTRGLDDLAAMSAHSMTGNTLSVAANRLSYVFDLHGPSLAVDTACSSSLVALHHACRALQAGEAKTALVGGVNLLLHPYPFVGFTKASMLSADGRCRPFDAAGKGYVRAEGGAVLLLKPLTQAIADGDDIQAVIRATGVNADGARKTGITIPSRAGQADLMRSVLAKSGLSAQDVDFIEAHGTGTLVGDPIETAAIGEVYGQGRQTPLPIGSVKANLGHLEPASGMAGLVKTILAFKYRALPPQLHLDTLNPNIDFAGLNLSPVREYLELEAAGRGPLVAGVNSFGFGGANAHVLLRAWSSARMPVDLPAALPPLFLSARSPAALQALAGRYAQMLVGETEAGWYDVAWTAACRRDRLEKRLVLVAASVGEAVEKLAACAQGEQPALLVREDALPQPGSIAFIYAGNGAQWLGMGRRLCEESPRFAEILADLDAQMRPLAGFSLLEELSAEGEAARIDDTVVAQPLLFAIQVAVTRLLGEQGVAPAAVAGHSVGEVAAAWAAGALDLAAAIRVIVARSKAQGETRGAGRMAAVGLAAAVMQTVLDEELGGALDVAIAGINSPNNVTLSGALADLERLQAHLAGRGCFFRLLDLDYAFHSRQMDPIRDTLLDSLEGLPTQAVAPVAFVSTVTGRVQVGEELGAQYWWRNVREPVRFADAITHLGALGCRVFIEIGPHAILQRYVSECLAAAEIKGRVLPTLRKDDDGWQRIAETAASAWLLTDKPDLEYFFPQAGCPVRLPNYPWQRERHWHPQTRESLRSIARRRVHPLLGWPVPEAGLVWENVLDPVMLPWLAEHKVGGAVVFPGAGYAEMALAAAREWLGGEHLGCEELDIVAPLIFDGEQARTLRFDLNPRDGGFQIKSRQRLSDDDWTLHAAGRILASTPGVPASRIAAPEAPLQRITAEQHYALAAALGLDYGPAFQGLRQAGFSGTALAATVQCPAQLSVADYLLHPALLDLCYQSLIDFFADDIAAGQGVALLPVKAGRLELYRRGDVQSFRARLGRRSARSVLADFELFDAAGQLLGRVSGCRFRAAPLVPKEQKKIDRWQVNPWLQPHPADTLATELPTPRELVEQLLPACHERSGQRQLWFKEALPLLEALALSFAFRACHALQQNDAGALPALLAADDPYVRWLLRLLQQEEVLCEQAGQWQLAADSSLPLPEVIWRTLLDEHPACLPQLVLLGRVGRSLARLLEAGSEARAAFLAELSRVPAADDLYTADPAYSGIGDSIENALRHLAAALPAGRRLRVLEIAGGVSEVARVVLDALPEDRIDYVLALPDENLASRQRAEYAQHPNLAVAVLNLADWQLAGDTALPEIFDVVIVRHVLHRAPNPRASLHWLRRRLAAGGILLLAERYPDWSADFLNGLASDWWRGAAADAAPASSLLPPAVWSETLRVEGFEDVLDFSEPAAKGLAGGAYLILAKTPALAQIALPAPEVRRWLLLCDAASAEFARQLATRLSAQGQAAEIADGALLPAAAACQHVVWLRGWQAAAVDAAPLLADALDTVRQLAAPRGQAEKDRPKLWLLTQGGALLAEAAVPMSFAPGFAPNPAQAALWGFGRVVMNEYPALQCTLLELGSAPAGKLFRLENELLHPDGSNEIVLTGHSRHVLMLQEVAADAPAADAQGGRFRLDFHLPGQLRNMVWLAQQERALRADEVEVRVQATGLNFRDVMYLMGLLPDEAVEKGFAGASLGLEFSGIVSRVGARVRDLQAGDKVIGFGSACFASHVITQADALAVMPDNWSFASAATVPTVFFTVYYALRQLADLQPGERVLIHGGAGGVGIAAIQLARHLGAEIFATAGSEEKRDFVHLLGADHVFDSRSLAFADDVLAATNGEGVDVILNSLAGEAIRRNLRVLKPFGRFLELGKRDFFENTPVGLRPFKDNISYFGIDADQLLTGRPQLAARLFREVMALFREGVLSPLPCRVFPAERVLDAFRVMQQARHIGKVVVSLADARPPLERPAAPPMPVALAKNSTWLVSGGLAGFGLASARWLAARGVGNLVLVGRRGLATPGAAEAIAGLQAQGVNVRAVACDITDSAAVQALVNEVRQNLPPLKGILHAAAGFDDALLQNLDAERIGKVIAPKLAGAWHLHAATVDVALEHFILYSSITTAIGNPGQANYVAANAGLEGLAALRRNLGLPAACIGWGPIGDAGYLTRNESVRDSLAQRLGKAPLLAEEALDQLDRFLRADGTQAVANFDWATLARLLPSAGGSRFRILNRSLGSNALAEDEQDFRSLIAGKSPEETARIVQQLVAQEVAAILAIGEDRIDPQRPLHDLGLDSLMAVELALGLEQRLGIQLPVMMLNDSPSVHKVSQRILEKLLGTADGEDGADAALAGMAQQHGESVTAEQMQQIAADVRDLADKGTRLAG